MLKNYLHYFLFISGVSVGLSQDQTVGLFLNTAAAAPGYTLFAPMSYNVTYLIDNNGELVKSWFSDYRPGLSVYILENGDLLRTRRLQGQFFQTGGRNLYIFQCQSFEQFELRQY